MSRPDTADSDMTPPESTQQGTAGGETAGPEATAAPETRAPETRAPETRETSVPVPRETLGPETTAPETVAEQRGGTGGTEAASPEQTEDGRTKLITSEKARKYQNRWNELKGQFVDDPQRALVDIDGLVGDVLSELEDTFRRQRGELESGLHGDQTSTEDLRQAFGKYREFFDRLLSV